MSDYKAYDLVEFNRRTEAKFVRLVRAMIQDGGGKVAASRVIALCAFLLDVSTATIKRYLTKHSSELGEFVWEAGEVTLRVRRLNDELKRLMEIAADDGPPGPGPGSGSGWMPPGHVLDPDPDYDPGNALDLDSDHALDHDHDHDHDLDPDSDHALDHDHDHDHDHDLDPDSDHALDHDHDLDHDLDPDSDHALDHDHDHDHDLDPDSDHALDLDPGNALDLDPDLGSAEFLAAWWGGRRRRRGLGRRRSHTHFEKRYVSPWRVSLSDVRRRWPGKPGDLQAGRVQADAARPGEVGDGG